MTYTQLAIWVDNNAYSDNCNDEKLYQYIFLLCYLFAYKWHYFSNSNDYDDFSLFAASILFERYKRKDLQQIKSVMNYIKKVLFAYKAQYQQQFFRENVTKEKLKEYDTNYDVSLEYELCDKVSGLNKCEFMIYLEDIPRTIKASLKNIPKKKNSYEWNNIYLSCLLTFLDLITITKESQKQIDEITKSEVIKTNLFLSLYKIPSDYKPILYHLDNSFSDYIKILVNKVRIEIKNDLKELLYSQVSVKDLYADALKQFQEEDDKSEY